MNLGKMEPRLSLLHERINSCRLCSKSVPNFSKPTSMERGEPGRIVIVGQGPGKSEIAKAKAFSGYSGKRLDGWLVRCGANHERPRAGIYLTSVIKCGGNPAHFQGMAHNCRPFLNHQLTIIRPALVITLGRAAYEELRFDQTPYDLALCKLFSSKDFLMMTSLGFHYKLLPWPHPSGLNRWHNAQHNQELLTTSFEIVAAFIIKR